MTNPAETFEETIKRGAEAIGFEATLECFYFPAISSGSLNEFLAAGREKLAYKIAEAADEPAL